MSHKHLYLAALLIALALRAYGLGDESLWLDENHTLSLIKKSWSGTTSEATQGPLFLLLEKLITDFVGTSEAALRLLSVLCGMGSIALIYRLSLVIFTPSAALWATWLAAVNPVMIHLSQDARPYALMVFLVLASVYTAIRIMSERKLWLYTAFILSTSATLYTHPYGVFTFLLVVSVWWLGSRQMKLDWKPLFVSMLLAGLLYSPRFIVYAERFLEKSAGGNVATWIAVPGFWHLLATPYLYFHFLPLAFSVIGLLIAAVLALRLRPKNVPTLGVGAALSIIVSFIILPWLVSVFITPIFVFRYTSPAIVGCFLLLGLAFTVIEKRWQIIFATAIFVTNLVPLHNYYTKLDKEPWREVAQIITMNSSSEQVYLADAGYIGESLDNYLPDYEKTRLRVLNSSDRIDDYSHYAPYIVRVSAYGKEMAARVDSITAFLHHGWVLTDSTVYPGPADVNPHTFSWVAPISVTRWEQKVSAID